MGDANIDIEKTELKSTNFFFIIVRLSNLLYTSQGAFLFITSFFLY